MNLNLNDVIATFITALIGILVTYIKNMIVERTQLLKTKTTEQQWLTILTIAKTVVSGVEQVASINGIRGEEKMKEALNVFDGLLKESGLELNDENKRSILESIVKNMNDAKNEIKE